MDRIDHAFYALSQRMDSIAMPSRTIKSPEPLTSLIDKVNAAKRMYEPGLRR
jgi:hypothetical protein